MLHNIIIRWYSENKQKYKANFYRERNTTEMIYMYTCRSVSY